MGIKCILLAKLKNNIVLNTIYIKHLIVIF